MNTPHREMVYDATTSTRAFKKYCKKHVSPVEHAYYLGEFYGYTRSNPYPMGRRHDEYVRGQKLQGACL